MKRRRVLGHPTKLELTPNGVTGCRYFEAQAIHHRMFPMKGLHSTDLTNHHPKTSNSNNLYLLTFTDDWAVRAGWSGWSNQVRVWRVIPITSKARRLCKQEDKKPNLTAMHRAQLAMSAAAVIDLAASHVGAKYRQLTPEEKHRVSWAMKNNLHLVGPI